MTSTPETLRIAALAVEEGHPLLALHYLHAAERDLWDEIGRVAEEKAKARRLRVVKGDE